MSEIADAVPGGLSVPGAPEVPDGRSDIIFLPLWMIYISFTLISRSPKTS